MVIYPLSALTAISQGLITAMFVIGLGLIIALLLRNIIRRKHAEQELRHYRDRLEKMVKDRAKELGQANAELQKEAAEREHAEEALHLNEARFRQIIDLVPHRIFAKGRDGRFILANRAMAEAYGMTPEEIVGKHDKDFADIEPEFSQHTLQDRKVMDSGQPLFIPKEIATLTDGEVQILQVTKIPYVVSGTDQPAVLGITIDITELKHAEDSLAKERMLLRTVINNLPDYIYVKDTEGRFFLDNLAHAHAMGVNNPEELIGKAEPEVTSIEAAGEQHQSADIAIIQSGQPSFNQEEWLISPDGRKQWLLSTKIPLRDSQGNIIGLVGISRDNTERKLAEEAYQQHTRELNLLNHMGNLLQACKAEDDAYSVMGSICKLLFPDDSGYLGIMNPSRTELKIVVSWGSSEPDDTENFGVAECWALRLDTTHYIEHPDTGLLCSHLDVFPENGYVCAPVSTADDVLGIFHLRFSPFDDSYSADECKRIKDSRRMMVNRVARHYALFIVNLRLRETLKREAIRDPLTGLYNRRHMEASLDRETHRAERLNTTVGLIMIDVDHFKRFNDTYGHEMGDEVLEEVGTVIKRNIRGEDIACRYGGEEFLVILPDTSPEHVKNRAEEIRQKIEDLQIEYQDEQLTITVSAGVAVFPRHGAKIETALKAADAALYQAKADGRNCVVMAPL